MPDEMEILETASTNYAAPYRKKTKMKTSDKQLKNFLVTTTDSHILIFFLPWRNSPPPQLAMAPSFTRFLDHTQQRTTVGRTPLDEWSARPRDLCLTTHNTHNRKTSMPHGGIRTHNPSRRAAADLRLRRRGHWDRLHCGYLLTQKCGRLGLFRNDIGK